jgi:anti-anti-sigma regulatory factor
LTAWRLFVYSRVTFRHIDLSDHVSFVRFSKISVLKGFRKVLTVDSSIQVGVCGPSVWVKVEGKGSFLNSENLEEFARRMLDQGYREFVVDLADCAMMDSTFMGTMARLALRLRELGHEQLHIVHCGSRNQELLSGLGLDRIFDISASGGGPPDCGPLEQTLVARSPEERKKTQTETMLQAHEALCEAAPENMLRYKDVLDFLRQELHYGTPSK